MIFGVADFKLYTTNTFFRLENVHLTPAVRCLALLSKIQRHFLKECVEFIVKHVLLHL